MNKPPKAPHGRQAKPPRKAAGVKTPAGRAKQPKADRHFVTALARGLEVLACYRHGDRVLGNQELSQRCGLAKSTVSRLTHTLTQLGYLIYVEDSAKYGLGTATLSLGSAMLSRLDIRKLAHPLMQQLAEFGQCMVSLGSRDRLSMIYIDAVRGSAAVTLSLDTGARIQIATSAMGRAYLTAIPEKERNAIMEGVRKLADASRWPDLQRGVAKALRDIRELGVCCSFGEYAPRSLSEYSLEACAGAGARADAGDAAVARAPIRRRLTGPAAKRAGEGAAGGKPQQIGDIADGVPRCAQIGQGEHAPGFIQYLLVGEAGVAQFPLQCAGAHVEKFGNMVLGRLAFAKPLRQHFANPPLNVLAFDLRQIFERNRIIVPRQLRVASVERALDGVAVEHQPGLGGPELQWRAQHALKIRDIGRRRTLQFDAQRRVVASRQRAAHA
jgi:DNA-binding IclR family transcriptional regulator